MTHPDPPQPTDPLIDEVREIRRAIWEEDGQDLRRHVERLREIERDHAGRVIKPAAVAAVEPRMG